MLVPLLPLLLSTASADDLWPDLSSSPRGSSGRNDAAVVVAIQDYAVVGDIAGAQSNGLDWYTYFTDGRGIPASRVTLLADAEGVKEDIEGAVETARAAVRPGGTLWFVFIGHGAPNKDGTDGLLVGWDTRQNARSIYDRGISQSDLLGALSQGKQAETMVIIDACFSGRGSTGDALVEGLMPLVPDSVTISNDVTVLSAGQSDEFAGPLPGVARPAFSYLVLGALRGWGDSDGDGQVSARETVDYSRDALAALPIGRSQTPMLYGDGDSTVIGRGREAGPRLSEIRKALVGNNDTVGGGVIIEGGEGDLSDTLAALAQLQADEERRQAEMSRLRQQVDAELASQEQTIQSEATDFWAQVTPIADKGGEIGEKALEAFIAKYDGVRITVGDQSRDVTIPEVDLAKKALARLEDDAMARPVLDTSDSQAERDKVTEYWRACRGGSALDCTRLGYRYANGLSVAQDHYRAVALYRHACSEGDALGCNNLGYMNEKGYGTRQDPSQAARLYRQGCDADNALSCSNLGVLYRYGRGISQDYVQAVSFYRQGCDGDDAKGCTNLGYMFEKGYGVSQSFSQAVSFYRQGCDGGNSNGCTNLGYMYEKGSGVGQSFSQAVSFYRQGCDGDHATGCNNLGAMYEDGTGVNRNYGTARELYQSACRQGSSMGCKNLGDLYRDSLGVTESRSKAREYYKKSCDLGDDRGCTALNAL